MDNHGHHASSVVAFTAVVGYSLEQALSELFDLQAWITESCETQQRLADSQNGADGKAEQVHMGGRDVLPEVAWPHGEPFLSELLEKLDV